MVPARSCSVFSLRGQKGTLGAHPKWPMLSLPVRMGTSMVSRHGKAMGRRFDHVYASRNFRPVSCQYLHELREQGLSDHSPVEVCFGFDERG